MPPATAASPPPPTAARPAGDRWADGACYASRVRRVALVLTLSGAFGAVGCSDEGSGTEFERPQIVPQSNVLCLSYAPVEVGSTTEHFVQLTNRGREPLLIEGAAVENDLRGSFSVDRVRTVDGVDCSEVRPCAIETGSDAVLRYFYAPPEAGWDSADLRVFSNAQNYPRLRLYVLALAFPVGSSPDAYDPGAKPEDAVGADGMETCP